MQKFFIKIFANSTIYWTKTLNICFEVKPNILNLHKILVVNAGEFIDKGRCLCCRKA